MPLLRTSLPLTALLLGWTAPLLANDEAVVAVIKTVSGSVLIVSDNTQHPAEIGATIHDHDILKTAKDATVGLIFKDNTELALGPDSQLAVDDFAYEPEQNRLSMVVSLASGTLHYVSGIIAKLKPEAISVKTPNGMIGVRGTHFLVSAGEQ
jgi:hypothetical protein